MPLEYNRCLICPVRGLCCYFSTLIDEKHNIILEDHPCTYLNIETGICTQFENRKEVFKNCLDIEDAKQMGGLPEGCLYLKKGDELKYPPKRKLREDDNLRIQKRYEYVNAMPHKNFQGAMPKFMIPVSDELEKKEAT